MRESFGAGMRQRRERAQISLGAIAEQTKIKVTLLEAMERDDVSQWPSGIFRRAFIRAYAAAIGLDPDEVVREFLDRYPDPIEDIGPTLAMAAGIDPSSESDGPPTRFRYLLGAAIDSLSNLRGGTMPPVRSTADLPAADRAAARTDRSGRDLLAAADLCTELGRVGEVREAAPLLEQVVKVLDAVGLIVWVRNPQATELTPALAHGYSDKVLAQLPKVKRDDDHATAAAFRSAQTSIVPGSYLTSGALVVPLMTSGGCVGVLALELRHDTVRNESVQALATIFAAQLARLVESARPARTVDRKLA
jgi:GAF domain-containing protein